MGMPGMSASDVAAYVQPKELVPSVDANAVQPKETSNKMTVAELRNRVNPITKYYDFMTAKAFIEDTTISMEDKIATIYGKNIAKGACIIGQSEAIFNEMKKVVA